jgi:hypothetical protein
MRVVTSDDIKKGMLLTPGECRYEQDIGGISTIVRTDRSWVGDVFEVMEVDRPFMVVRMLVTRYGAIASTAGLFADGRPRNFQLSEPRQWFQVSTEFLRALCPDFKAPVANPESDTPTS